MKSALKAEYTLTLVLNQEEAKWLNAWLRKDSPGWESFEGRAMQAAFVEATKLEGKAVEK